MRKKFLFALLVFALLISVLPMMPSVNKVFATPNATGSSTLAIKNDGSLWGWGLTKEQSLPVKILDGASVIVSTPVIGDSDGRHMIIKTDGSLWGWGRNGSGELGDGTTEYCSSSVKIMDDVIFVSLGDEHTVAIRADGSLWGWGSNSNGQIGSGDGSDNILSPVKIMDSVASVSAGTHWTMYTMAVKTDGSLWGWGANIAGQLGDGTTEERHLPVKIMDDVASVSTGQGQTMAIKTDGSLWAWGANTTGQLGDGTRTDRYSPVKIMTDVTSVAMGGSYSMAVKKDGGLWAWGANEYTYGVYGDQHGSRLGDGTRTDQLSPVKIMDSVASVSIGYGNNMAIKTDGSLWVWGNNFYDHPTGQSDDYYNDRNMPMKVMDNVAAASTGIFFDTYYFTHFYTMAIKTDGSLWAWGFNERGQLGDGTNVSTNTPVKIMDGVRAVSTGTDISVPTQFVAPPTGDSGILFALLFLTVIIYFQSESKFRLWNRPVLTGEVSL